MMGKVLVMVTIKGDTLRSFTQRFLKKSAIVQNRIDRIFKRCGILLERLIIFGNQLQVL